MHIPCVRTVAPSVSRPSIYGPALHAHLASRAACVFTQQRQTKPTPRLLSVRGLGGMVCVCVCVERNRTGNEPEGVGSDQVIREDPAGAVVGERFLLPCLAAG